MATRSVNPQWRPLSRSYGAILQSSLTTVLPSALSLLDSPTCVSFSTVNQYVKPLEDFLGHPSDDFRQPNGPGPVRLAYEADFPILYLRQSTYISSRTITFRMPSLHQVRTTGAGILTCYPSSTPFGLD